ncbi:MAG: translation elongation factor Ts, partial [Myxococcota bacterium]
MAEIAAKEVKALRDQTGAGMMDCKRALADADGDAAKATSLLRERGLAKAGKRAGRETSEGAIGICLDAAAAGIVELGCETDFVAKTEDFQALVSQIAGVVANAEVGDVEQVLAAKVGDATVSDRIQTTITKVGENIKLKRVARLDLDGGVGGGYVHAGGKLGVIIALAGASDAKPVKELARDLAMHVAAADPPPVAVDRDGVPSEVIEQERAILQRQAEQTGKPAQVVERIVDGRV